MKKLLFVEDESDFSGLVTRLREEVPKMFCGELELIVLRELGMAKHVLSTNNVALVVLDLTLPDSMQVDTIRWVAETHRQWPIYVLTGDERIEVRRECLYAGAVGFALKKHVLQSPNFFFAELYNAHVVHARDHGNSTP